MSRALPAPLAGWGPALSGLAPGLAEALGPLVRGLDDLVRRGDAAGAGAGEPDGYAGLSRRGDPERILPSEWALALELPAEFLRRAAGGELLHLEPARRDRPPRGRVVVLVDRGPGVLGAGRLVQLAALVVLHRRAADRRGELRVGLLGDDPDRWHGGGPETVLDSWLRARSAVEPDPADVADRIAGLDRPDEAWLLAGPDLAAALPGRRRTVVATESAWAAAGATAVGVLVDGRRAELALPPGPVAVRALRGAATRRDRSAGSAEDVRQLTFSGAQPVLLARGAPDELVRIPVGGGRPKRHRFTGPVLAATVAGRRLIALVDRGGGEVAVQVIGKNLRRLDGVTVPAAGLGLTPADLAALAAAPPAPLYRLGSDLLVRPADRWFRLSEDGPPRAQPYLLAVLPRDQVDQPVLAMRIGGHLQVDHHALRADAGPGLVLGPSPLAAWPVGGGRWRLTPGGLPVEVGPGESVLAVHRVDGDPVVVTVSAAGVLVRLRGPAGSRTLTGWSGGLEPPVVHPTRPWIALRDKDGAVVVGDLDGGARLLRLAGPL